jgi:hypothetical protein
MRSQLLARAVARAVVDEHELVVEPVQRGRGARVERVERRLLVVERRDDAQQSGLAHRRASLGSGTAP